MTTTTKKEYQHRYYEAHKHSKAYEDSHKHHCPVCGKMIVRRSEFCVKHRRTYIGKDNPNWKGGRIKNRDGYILLSLRDHPRANARHQVFEHIVIWEKAHGPTPKRWQIHHINGVKDDNRLENLIALPPKSHHHNSPLRKQLKTAQARIRDLEYQLKQENRLL